MSHHRVNRRLPVRAVLAAAAPLLALAGLSAGGCAQQRSPELRLTSLESKAQFLQQFSRAYVSKGDNGRTEIVLVDQQDVTGDLQARAGEPIPASASDAAGAVRQVMHVKVLWKPQRGTKQHHPSYTKAGLRWYVLRDAGGAAPDVLEYTGAGFVALADTAAGTQVRIKNASLKPVGTPGGSLTDPVGPARLTGTFLAKKSPRRVDALLAEVRSAVNGATAPHAFAE